MHAYDREQILSAFRAATRSEVKQVTFAANFDIVDFEALDYYGWADPKTPPDVPQGHRLERIRAQQVEDLQRKVRAFVDRVLSTES